MKPWPPYIRGLNQVKIEFLHLKPSMIRVESIFLHLAKTCRYNGLVEGWYSNAEHSILCFEKATTSLGRKACLIHDFGEMITGDVPGPVKVQCPDYQKLADDIQDFMYWHFLGSSIVPDEVKIIDKRVCATEQQTLRGSPLEDLNGHEPYGDIQFHGYEWREAYWQIKNHFRTLFPEYQDSV